MGSIWQCHLLCAGSTLAIAPLVDIIASFTHLPRIVIPWSCHICQAHGPPHLLTAMELTDAISHPSLLIYCTFEASPDSITPAEPALDTLKLLTMSTYRIPIGSWILAGDLNRISFEKVQHWRIRDHPEVRFGHVEQLAGAHQIIRILEMIWQLEAVAVRMTLFSHLDLDAILDPRDLEPDLHMSDCWNPEVAEHSQSSQIEILGPGHTTEYLYSLRGDSMFCECEDVLGVVD